jgi:hypothetical protein
MENAPVGAKKPCFYNKKRMPRSLVFVKPWGLDGKNEYEKLFYHNMTTSA